MVGLRLAALLVLVLLAGACTDSDRAQAPTEPAPQIAPPRSERASPVGEGTSGSAGGQPVTIARRPSGQLDPNAFQLAAEPLARGFQQPLFVTHAPDGRGRLFVVQQGGLIRIVNGTETVAEPFLDVRSIVRAGGEQGLLGLAFHPRYGENGRFFINYTQRNGANTVAEYRASADPNRADGNSGRILLAIEDFAANHNGGMLVFGPDGYLYIGTGDGGGGGDPQRTAQDLGALLGKMLRIDVDQGEPYAVPADNPFVGRAGARPEIWAYGLRNPWRYSFDRATGDLWIADVGQNALEEINLQPAGSRGGENYGWSITEGTACFRPRDGCDTTGLTMPVVEYGRDAGCSVTGGYVYRGNAHPTLDAGYVYADYCSGRIWTLTRTADGAWQPAALLRLDARISSFGEDEAGELYLTAHNTGVIYRLVATPR